VAARSKSVEHRRLVGRKPGVDAAGNKLPDAMVSIVPAVNFPALPESLGKLGRDAWERIWSVDWMLPHLDIAAVTRLCEMYEEREAMRAAIVEEGWMVDGSKGQRRANPLIDRVSKINHEIRLLEMEFGLTPAARSRLGYTEARRVSKLDEMMRRQRER
jgi:P27 family predicted phage terminase small subunit